MAATDVKTIYVKTLENGERWLYAILCNGTEEPIHRICNCDGDPDDPGNIPDPIEDADTCRIANGIGAYIQGRANYFATLLGEQPDNDFGSFSVALSWLTSTYGIFYPAQLWEATRQLAVDYNNTDESLLGDGVPAGGQYYACAAYQAILVDENGINLSPSFAENYSTVLLDFTPDMPNAELTYTIPFVSRIISLITLAVFKRVAFEASGVDPIEAGDYDCETCFGDPDPGTCSEDAFKWVNVDATPAGWSQVGALPDVDLGNLGDEFDRCPNLQASRTNFGNWEFAGTIASDGVQCIGIKKTFGSPCKITKAGVRFVSDSQASKAAAIYVKVGATYTMISGTFDQAPAPNTFQVTYQGGVAGIEDVDEIHFVLFTGSSNPSLSLNLKVTDTSINADLPPV